MKKEVEKNDGLLDFFKKSFDNIISFFCEEKEKYTLSNYYDTSCDKIEKLIDDIENCSDKKCYGGSCNFSFAVIKKSLSVKKMVLSNIELYFNDDKDNWEKVTASGKIPFEIFDDTDQETIDFLTKIEKGEIITEKIEGRSNKR